MHVTVDSERSGAEGAEGAEGVVAGGGERVAM